MKYRKLRIAWSVWWGVVAVLLVVMWVRSYSTCDSFDWIATPEQAMRVTSWHGRVAIEYFDDAGDDRSLVTPYWYLLPIASIFITAPWLPCHFSLRTLLIATTLVVVGLGAMIWATR